MSHSNIDETGKIPSLCFFQDHLYSRCRCHACYYSARTSLNGHYHDVHSNEVIDNRTTHFPEVVTESVCKSQHLLLTSTKILSKCKHNISSNTTDQNSSNTLFVPTIPAFSNNANDVESIPKYNLSSFMYNYTPENQSTRFYVNGNLGIESLIFNNNILKAENNTANQTIPEMYLNNNFCSNYAESTKIEKVDSNSMQNVKQNDNKSTFKAKIMIPYEHSTTCLPPPLPPRQIHKSFKNRTIELNASKKNLPLNKKTLLVTTTSNSNCYLTEKSLHVSTKLTDSKIINSDHLSELPTAAKCSLTNESDFKSVQTPPFFTNFINNDAQNNSINSDATHKIMFTSVKHHKEETKRKQLPSLDIYQQNLQRLNSAVTAKESKLISSDCQKLKTDNCSSVESIDKVSNSSSSLSSSSSSLTYSGGELKCSTSVLQPVKENQNGLLPTVTSKKVNKKESIGMPVASIIKPVNPAVYRWFIEQKFANVGRIHKEREERQARLETEMEVMGLSDASRAHMRKMLRTKESNHMRMQRARLDESMFSKIKRIGVGAFGWVWLVRKKDNSQLYAMKILKKRDVVRRRQLAHVQAERDILAEADSEWVVKLFFSFQDLHALYLVMEYIPGGDMMSLLIKKEIFDEELARFYIAELTLALESVHKLGFIHRDIKPDNILINQNGHIKLTDFGLCTSFRWTHSSKYWDPILSLPQPGDSSNTLDIFNINNYKTDATKPKVDDRIHPIHDQTLERRIRSSSNRRCAKSLVGTPNYIAPEILRRQEYNQACDWWSVGVILYEMMVGRPPFVAQTALDTQIRVVQWSRHLTIPGETRLNVDAANLISRLLCDPEDRLADPNDLKKHPFFSDINWDLLPSQTPPYVPMILDELDTSNFDSIDDEVCESDNGTSLGNCVKFDTSGVRHSFPDFTFKRFFDQNNPDSKTSAWNQCA